MVLAKGALLEEGDLPDALFAEPSGEGAITLPMGTSMEEMEKTMLNQTLKLTRGNKKLAAQLLGISLRTVYRILDRQQGVEE